MKNVSADYNRVMTSLMRPATKIRATLHLIDRAVKEDSTVTNSGQMNFSTDVLSEDYSGDYITFEKNFFKVGSNQRIVSDSDRLPNGFVSSDISDWQGYFTYSPSVTINFGNPHALLGLTCVFGEDYVTEGQIKYYNASGLANSHYFYPTKPVYFDDYKISDCTRIEITFNKIKTGYHRLRVHMIQCGSDIVFENNNVIEASHKRFIDPVSSSLSYDKMSLTVENFKKQYNPDNPKGIWEYFQNGQIMEIEYGVPVGNSVEWIKTSELRLSDAPKVGSNYAEFEAKDKLFYLSGTYRKGVYRPEGVSLYTLAQEVLSDAGVSDYKLSPVLREVYSVAPLPMITHKECLQIIANAAECVLYTNSDGTIIIEEQNSVTAIVTDNGRFAGHESPGKVSALNVFPKQYVSEAVTDYYGSFSTHPNIQIQYSEPIEKNSVSFVFDAVNGVHPYQFNLTFSRNGVTIKSENVTQNYQDTYNVSGITEPFDKITIEIYSLNKSYTRAVIDSVVTGEEYYLDYSVALEKPIVKKLPELRQVDMTVHNRTVENEPTDLYRETVKLTGEDQKITVEYQESVDHKVNISTGTLVSYKMYAAYGEIIVRGNGSAEVSVTGNVLNDDLGSVSLRNSYSGEICPVDNPLINDSARAIEVGRWIANYCQARNSYDLNFRQDFRLEPNDVIQMKTEFEDHVPARITKLEYKFPGQGGKISLRRSE